MTFNVGDIVRYKPSIHPAWANQSLIITEIEDGIRYKGSGEYPSGGRFDDAYLGNENTLELFYPETSSDFEVDI